jgi:hypothetical protein
MTSELDILSVHSKIIIKFKQEEQKLEKYQIRKTELKRILNISRLSISVEKKLEEELNILETHMNDLNLKTTQHFYLMDTTQILERYKHILQQPIKISFMGKTNKKHPEKNKIIKQYLKIARNYIDIDLEKFDIKNDKITCTNCTNKKEFDVIDNIHICLKCGSQQEIMTNISSYKDIDRVNVSTKYTYDRRVHFRDCVNQFQGKQNSTIDDKVYEDLEMQFELHGLLLGDKATEKEVRFSNIKRQHIYLFLKETEHTKHYEDAILIWHNMTGKTTPDITHLEDKLLYDFDLMGDLYDRIFKKNKKIERANFINTQYVLFQLLKKHKYPCKKEDFNILKTADRKSFHDDICKELFENLGWNFTSLW